MNNSILRSITVFFAIYFASCIVSYAQIDSPYLPDSLYGTTVTLKANKRIYAPTYEQASLIRNASLNKLYYNFTIDIANCKTKKIPKQSSFVVLGFLRTKEDIDYDLYGVLFKNLFYYIRPEDVVDNSLLEETNLKIREEYDRLLNEESRLKRDYDNLIQAKEREISQALADIEKKEDRKEFTIDSLSNAKIDKETKSIMKDYNEWYEYLTPTGQKIAKILTIQQSTLCSPNSAGGCDYTLEFTNMSNKTIKYLYWYGSVYNAVNDKVACSIRDTYFFSGKDTGPYPPNDICEANWDNVIYNYSANEMRLSKITIVYMDGTSVNLSAKDILCISDAPQCVVPYYRKYLYRENTKTKYNNKLSRQRATWERRNLYLDDIDNHIVSQYPDLDIYYQPIKDLRKEIEETSTNIKNFESRNYITK